MNVYTLYTCSRAAVPEGGEVSLERNRRARKRLSQQLMLSEFYPQVQPLRYLVSYTFDTPVLRQRHRKYCVETSLTVKLERKTPYGVSLLVCISIINYEGSYLVYDATVKTRCKNALHKSGPLSVVSGYL